MRQDWDNFWKNDPGSRAKGISWSKRRVVAILGQIARPGQRALDAGCGSGFFSRFFCDQGLETVSLDYSSAALELTRQTTAGRSQILSADLLGQKLPDLISERFDVIFTDGLFEHFPAADQDRILRNFISVLSPQGKIVTFVPNRWSPWQVIRPFFMPGITETPFTMSKLLDLNQRCGLEVVKSGGVNTLPWRISPEGFVAARCGMLLYTISSRI